MYVADKCVENLKLQTEKEKEKQKESPVNRKNIENIKLVYELQPVIKYPSLSEAQDDFKKTNSPCSHSPKP